jgi:hypothetical protein
MPGQVNCRVINGINNVCGDLMQASGVDKDFWVGYISDLSVKFVTTLTAPIATIQFYPYNGLVKFSGRKYAHKFDWEGAVAAGGSISIPHKAMIKLMNLSTQDDAELVRLMQAQDMFIIYQDNNEAFKIGAPTKGYSYVPGPIQTTGQNDGEDVLSVLNFISSERVPPLRFTTGGTTQANIDYLDSLVR